MPERKYLQLFLHKVLWVKFLEIIIIKEHPDQVLLSQTGTMV